MATPGQLVRTMADVLGIAAASVAQYDRQLAEGGLRSKGGRGRSAAKVTPEDAANLLIAIMGSPVSGPSIKIAAEACKKYGSLQGSNSADDVSEFFWFGLKTLARLPAKHNLKDAISALIGGASRGELFRSTDNINALQDNSSFKIKLINLPLLSIISCEGSFGPAKDKKIGQLVYGSRLPDSPLWSGPNLTQERQISFRTIRVLGELLKDSPQ